LKINYELESENDLTKLREYFYRTIEIVERGKTKQNWDEKQSLLSFHRRNCKLDESECDCTYLSKDCDAETKVWDLWIVNMLKRLDKKYPNTFELLSLRVYISFYRLNNLVHTLS